PIENGVGKVDTEKLKQQIDLALKSNPGPVVLLVHGFMFDPGDDPLAVDTGNPHAAIFHYREHGKKHWKHDFGWPRGLSFQDRKWLPVAFGWNSNPPEFEKPAELSLDVFELASKVSPLKAVALSEAFAKLWSERSLDVLNSADQSIEN